MYSYVWITEDEKEWAIEHMRELAQHCVAVSIDKDLY